MRAGGSAFSQMEVLVETSEPSPQRVGSQFLYLNLHHPGTVHLALVIFLRLQSTQLCPLSFPYKGFFLTHALNLLEISQTRSIWPLCDSYLLLNGPRPDTSGSQPQFSGWPLLGIPLSNTSSCHLLMLGGPNTGHLIDNFRPHQIIT